MSPRDIDQSMSVSEASRKVDGGKFVKVRLSTGETDEAVEVEVVGDFFIYPESGIETVETAIEESLGAQDCDNDGIEVCLRRSIEEDGIEMVGITAETVAETALEAYGGVE